MQRDFDDPRRAVVLKASGTVPAANYLAEFDIVVNCVTAQDTDAPLMFVEGSGIDAFAPGSLIVDVLRRGDGFRLRCGRRRSKSRSSKSETPCTTTPWTTARRTYGSPRPGTSARDHPVPLGPVMSGPATWDLDPTLSKAIEIRDGVIQNPKDSVVPIGRPSTHTRSAYGRRRIEREVSRHPLTPKHVRPRRCEHGRSDLLPRDATARRRCHCPVDGAALLHSPCFCGGTDSGCTPPRRGPCGGDGARCDRGSSRSWVRYRPFPESCWPWLSCSG